ncbi:fimbria/pilus outer membrane usher protein [Yersinia aleksiciae]|uniref:Fimbrial protein n=1 Tax=Yersinia aleksiciae TaxID=263819 RepID=A0ABM5U9C4_YERAE|nr:fimbria/pilus outer membrane usher protein [Yersinia aleksiciae]AKP32305.1 fimbrial protein [Yersinia aleksiciae]MDA5498458.1 fimbrial biogenesis outer membrane usher protein [Yersinia aleksiciae]NIK98934.1 fimbrial biogenesis outer membrane usher protein [Yersinia aleksiciae]WQC72109.1 fimbria/pilus outer membrane usher protein [Yersinia aleksiciae]CFQ53387.1 fimbrial usher protein [Yersinia aleksiciae]
MRFASWLSCLLTHGLLVSHSLSAADEHNQDEYVFEDALIRGSSLGLGSISRFNKKDSYEAGKYQVDLYMNNKFVDRVELTFIAKGDDVVPCLSGAQLLQAGVEEAALKSAHLDDECLDFKTILPASDYHFDYAKLRFDLSVPQLFVKNMPRGYVDPRNLTSGDTIGFSNYNFNQYHVGYNKDGIKRATDSSYLSLTNGINAGMWRFRQQGSLRYDQIRGANWTSNRLYSQRALPSIGSEVTAGETFSSGQFFSSMGFTGIALATDDRMLPESQRGYAPVVRGIARTNAKVTVYQNGRPIYQSTVSPGQFEFDDLSATNFGGDLTVEIQEADGSLSTFQVPFSSVPESLRPGYSRYSFAAGKVRDQGNHELFSELTYQRGVSNAITANSGLRLAPGYQALMLGGVFTHYIGALGLDVTYSKANLPDDEQQSGWMARAAFSRTFEATNTTLSVAGYRYSTEGYRDLSDVLGVRAASHSKVWSSGTYQQRSRAEISLNQSFNHYGSLYLTASSQDYRNDRKRDTQLQLGYANTLWRDTSFNLAVSQQKTGGGSNEIYFVDPGSGMPAANGANLLGVSETVVQMSISFPLGGSPRAPYISAGAVHSQTSGASYQTSLSGVMGDDQSASYSMDFARSEQSKENTFSGSLQKRLPVTSLSGSASSSPGYWQGSASARGSAAFHSGGVTLGPYLSDTFALIEAKGASGAKVMYGQGARIDHFGYALVPTLTPYRYNTITLDPDGMDFNTELQDGERQIAPYAGSTVKVTFRTLSGYPVLISVRLADGSQLPMGTVVYSTDGSADNGHDDNSQEHQVGMVGQASQAYLRAENPRGTLILAWGDAADERCKLDYDLGTPKNDQQLYKLDALCVVTQP